MVEEGTEQWLWPLEGAGFLPGGGRQGEQVQQRPVGQGVGLQVAPGVFDRVQLGGIRREEERLYPDRAGDPLLDLPRAVGAQAIPD